MLALQHPLPAGHLSAGLLRATEEVWAEHPGVNRRRPKSLPSHSAAANGRSATHVVMGGMFSLPPLAWHNVLYLCLNTHIVCCSGDTSAVVVLTSSTPDVNGCCIGGKFLAMPVVALTAWFWQAWLHRQLWFLSSWSTVPFYLPKWPAQHCQSC